MQDHSYHILVKNKYINKPKVNALLAKFRETNVDLKYLIRRK